MNCPGSVTFPENQEQGESSSFADNGTASHKWAADCLESGRDAESYIGATILINDVFYEMDEERAGFCQLYIDDVRRRAIGGSLFVEYSVDLSEVLCEGQGGTCDAGIYLPETKHLIVEDLKYGTGEKVFASDNGKMNPQLGLYLLGLIEDMKLLGREVETVTGVICQPRLRHIDEHTMTAYDLFLVRTDARIAIAGSEMSRRTSLRPGDKQCRWCRAKAKCPALAQFVKDQVRSDFENVQPVAPRGTEELSRAYIAVPLIDDWCRAVRAEVNKQVAEGAQVLGPDGKPFKFVEGKEGNRTWSDAEAAEAALLGQLSPEKVYQPKKIITAPQAAKLLDKKASKALWTDFFEPMITRPRGQPLLALGSDPRPPVSSVAAASEFEEVTEE